MVTERKIIKDLIISITFYLARGRDVSCQKRLMGDKCTCLQCSINRAKKHIKETS